MFLYYNVRAAVLLLASTLTFAHTFFVAKEDEVRTLVKTAISSMEVPWINRIDSFTRASDSLCADEIAAFSSALADQETWALQMLDASSKLQSGILQGNIQNIGAYDQCIKVDGEYNGTTVRGQHCTVPLSIISSSICVPSSCNETEVGELISGVIQNVTGTSEFEVQVSCVEQVSETFATEEVLTIVFFATVGAFMVLCTICDIVKRSTSGELSATVNVLAKFSLYTNAINILSTKTSSETLPAIHGIRFLSMAWVVLAHRFVNSLYMPTVNLFDIFSWYDSWYAVYIQLGTYAVDTFFVVSGFLMTYLFLKSKQSGKRSNFPMMYLHRYLRLTPCMAVLVLFVAVLLHRVANGPVWGNAVQITVEPCRKSWWINLLYVQNFVNTDSLCLGHSWYLAVDMQLFWISPFILYPLSRWPKYGLSLLGLLLVASVAMPPVTIATNGYSTALFRIDQDIENALNSFYDTYIPTYNRACAYFVGILLGYEVANNKRHLTRMNVAINWGLACIFLFICTLATHYSYNSNFEYNLVVETVLATILRPIWSIAISWIIYACTQGYGGVVTRFLSLPIFLPLSRLSYCIYLVHYVIQSAKVSATLTPGRFSQFIVLNNFWADLGLSIGVAFILSLFFESPVIILEKILFNRGRGGQQLSRTQELKKDVEGGIDNKGLTES